MGRTVRRLVMLLVIGASVAGVINVYADGRPVEDMARRLACGGRAGAACGARLMRVARTPFFHDLRFQDGRRTVDVRCRRSMVLVGDWSCAVTPA